MIKKWMVLLFIAPVYCCAVTSIYAQPRWDGGIEVFGEVIYFRPTTCDLSFVIEDSAFEERDDSIRLPHGREHTVRPNYDWGFRFGAGYIFDGRCFDIRLIYSRLCRKSHAEVCAQSEGVIWPTFGPPKILSPTGVQPALKNGCDPYPHRAKAHAVGRFEWEAIEGQVAARCYRTPCLFVRGHIGLHWAEVRIKQTVHYQGQLVEQETPELWFCAEAEGNGRTWGIGPQLGFDGRWDIACGFGVAAHAGAGLLAGESRNIKTGQVTLEEMNQEPDQEGEETTSSVDVFNRSHGLVFPELDCALAITYTYCCGSRCYLFFELGYEVRAYINALPRLLYVDAISTSSNHNICESFNLDGIYFRALLQF